MRTTITLLIVCIMGAYAAFYEQDSMQEVHEHQRINHLGLHQKKKDSLKIAVNKMLPEGLEKGQGGQ
ncbi:MAG: hypothetical protein ACR2MT_17685 [Aurantibacter sp.]